MSIPVFGNTIGLNAREAEALKSLGLFRVAQNLLITRELAHRMTSISEMLHRKVGVIIGRNGHVECAILGDAERAYLPDIGRSRAGLNRLRGIRFVVTSLDASSPGDAGARLTMDEITDLAKLRLDFVVSIEANVLGAPGCIEFAHIIPSARGIEVERTRADAIESLPQNADEILRAVETELRSQAETTM